MNRNELTPEELRALHDIYHYGLSLHIPKPVMEALKRYGLIEFSWHQAQYILTDKAIELFKE